MPEATTEQIQSYVDNRVRRRSEQIRDLLEAMRDDKAVIDDIYAALTGSHSGWVDARTDAPPHLATAANVLAWNACVTTLIATLEDGDTQYAVVQSLCVRPVLED